jgi:AraC-like DNA-binding protein
LQDEGTSFRELRGKAIDRWARQYLQQTDLSVEAIAATLGYQDTANFRRAFRKRTGMTPGQFRSQGVT